MLKLTMDYKMTKHMLNSCTLKESRTWLLVCTRHCYFIPFNHEHPVRVTCQFRIGGASCSTCRCVNNFLQTFTRRHVPRATCRRSTRHRRHRRSGGSVRRSVAPRSRSDQPFGRHVRKCLNTQTDRLTNTSRPTFFSPTHRRKSSFIRTCYAIALAPFILYDFGLEAGIAKHCLGPKS